MKQLSVLLLLFIVSACATPYQRRGFTGGYSESRLAPNIFRVDFQGNGYTGWDRAYDFMLLRSADLTLQNGFKYFVIVDTKESSTQMVITTPTTTQTTVSGNSVGTVNNFGSFGTYHGTTYGTATTHTYGGHSFLITKPRTSNTNICFKEPPEDAQMVFDAEFMQRSLKAKYTIP